MKTKTKIISVIAALCLLGSAACFSVFAAESVAPSGDEETAPAAAPAAAEPAPAVEQPAVTEPAAPIEEPQTTYEPTVEPQPATDPAPSVDPGYVEDPAVAADPVQGGETTTPSDGGEYTPTYSDVISDGNFPQPTYTPPEVYNQPSTYVDTTEQYNQYLYYTAQAQYDDNYIYVPEYQEPTESLISTPSKTIDTDELTNSDWNSIILDLSNGAADTEGGTQTFSFIKDNEETGDTDMMWLVYVGAILIIISFLLVVYVVVSTSKANMKHEYVYI